MAYSCRLPLPTLLKISNENPFSRLWCYNINYVFIIKTAQHTQKKCENKKPTNGKSAKEFVLNRFLKIARENIYSFDFSLSSVCCGEIFNPFVCSHTLFLVFLFFVFVYVFSFHIFSARYFFSLNLNDEENDVKNGEQRYKLEIQTILAMKNKLYRSIFLFLI